MLPTSSAVPWASVVTVSPRPARVSSTQAAVATRASSSVVTAAGRLAGVGTGGTCVWADEGEERGPRSARGASQAREIRRPDVQPQMPSHKGS